MGNEAADADSIISSICYSFYHQMLVRNLSDTADDIISCHPVACIKRNDLRLRRDVSLLLENINVDLDDILCVDDSLVRNILAHNNSRIILVDHNVICNHLAEYENKVIEIIDHHKDIGKHKWVEGNYRHIAFDDAIGNPTAGSTCSLVAEKFIDSLSNEFCIDIATVLLAVIDIDTIAMNPVFQKGTQRDANVINYIMNKYPTIQREQNYNTIKNAKNDPIFWNSLTAQDTFRLDYKSFNTDLSRYLVGISSVLLPLEKLITKPDFLLTLESYLYKSNESSENKYTNECCDIFSIMSFYDDPIPKRELLVVSKSEILLDTLSNYLLDSASNNLQLRPLTSSELNLLLISNRLHARFFSQSNVKMSRKQVAPLLVDFMNNYLM